MRYLLFALGLLHFNLLVAQQVPSLRDADKVRIKEATDISKKYGDSLFPGSSSVPFAILLITDSVEFLIHHPNPTTDFILLGKDDLLNTNIYYRKRKYDTRLLATFPAVNGVSCVVVGTPENTNKQSTEWVITLLHEHFHQYQNSDPEYFKSVDALGLSKGDQTGMWMLHYPFPYDSLPVMQQYDAYTAALHKALLNIDSVDFPACFKHYQKERSKFKASLSQEDYRYFSFQLWQEGLARYAEYIFLEGLRDYEPSKSLAGLADFIPFAVLKRRMYQWEINNLRVQKLQENKRISFYTLGFAEGVLLDKVNPVWRKRYLSEKFFIENYWPRLHIDTQVRQVQ